MEPVKTIKNPDALFLRLGPLKQRLLLQCKRLSITQTALIKQALTKYLEEEEAIQYRVNKRG